MGSALVGKFCSLAQRRGQSETCDTSDHSSRSIGTTESRIRPFLRSAVRKIRWPEVPLWSRISSDRMWGRGEGVPRIFWGKQARVQEIWEIFRIPSLWGIEPKQFRYQTINIKNSQLNFTFYWFDLIWFDSLLPHHVTYVTLLSDNHCDLTNKRRISINLTFHKRKHMARNFYCPFIIMLTSIPSWPFVKVS